MFKLFTSFKDVKRKINVNGIGLGLVISRMIVDKFNGKIDFTSTYKHGSTFFFTFEHVPYSNEELQQINNNPIINIIKNKTSSKTIGLDRD